MSTVVAPPVIPTGVLIAVEQDLLRKGMEGLFAGSDDLEVVASTHDFSDAVEEIGRLQPSIVVLGFSTDSANECAVITQKDPEAKILLLAPPGCEGDVVEAFKNGACGCLLTDLMADDIIEVIRLVAKGQMVLPQTLAGKGLVERRKMRRNPPNLSIRELEVIQLMANGLRNKEIAAELYLSEITVKTHVSRILRKLGKSNRTAAILHAYREGWVTFGD